MSDSIKDFESAIAELETDREAARGRATCPLDKSLGALRTRRRAVALLPRAARRGRTTHRAADRTRRAPRRVAPGRSRTTPTGDDARRHLAVPRGPAHEVEAALERVLQHGAAPDGHRRTHPLLPARSAASACGRASRWPPPRRVGASAQPDGRSRARLALPAACAVEMVHTYSLVHDDLPAMDDDALRRGRPTTHIVLRRRHGDPGRRWTADRRLRRARVRRSTGHGRRRATCRRRPAAPRGSRPRRAAGSRGMVGGQAIDLAAVGRRADARLDAAALEDMHARKTGALIRAASTMGAIVAGGDADDGRRDRSVRARPRTRLPDRRRRARRRRIERRVSARPPARTPPPASRRSRRCYGLDAVAPHGRRLHRARDRRTGRRPASAAVCATSPTGA